MKASSPKKKLPDNSGSFFVAYLTEKTRGKTEKPRGEGWRNPEEKRTGKNVKEGREKSRAGAWFRKTYGIMEDGKEKGLFQYVKAGKYKVS